MTPKCHVVLSVCLVFLFWVGGGVGGKMGLNSVHRWNKLFYIYIYFSFSGKLQSHNEEGSRGSSQGKKTD